MRLPQPIIRAMRAIERLLEQLNYSFGDGAWHGPALREVLDGVSDDDAKAHPIAGAHSILEIAVHCGTWMDASTARLSGDERELTTEEDWSDVTTTTFANAVEELEHAQSRLCDAVARLTVDDLDRLVTGRRYSHYVLIHGVIQHNLYHAGQISLLRRALAR
jgi:uncharacterized damage-inducible protein DinB